MDEEKLNRTMEFIIEQQANFTVNIQLLQEAHSQGEKRLSRLEGAFVTMYNDLNRLTKNVEVLSGKVTELSNDIVVLKDEQKETRERLDAFIVVLEKYISRDEEKNGGSKKKK
jgi:archaellum component FlaC